MVVNNFRKQDDKLSRCQRKLKIVLKKLKGNIAKYVNNLGGRLKFDLNFVKK